MKRVLFYIAVLFLFAILNISCSESSVESKIDGAWIMLKMDDLNPDYHDEWTLLGGYIYMINTQYNDTISYGNYNIKIKRFNRYLCLSECSKDNWNGDYQITKLNSKYLVLVKDQDALEMYEFTKK